MDVNVMKSVVRENFARQNWQQNSTDELVEKCAKEINDSSNFSLDKFGLKCNTKMAQFSYCMWRQFTISCPAEKQQKTRQCEKLRMVLKKNSENKFEDT